MAHAEKDRLIESHEPRWSSVFIWLGFFLAFCLLQGVVVWSMIAGAWWLTILAVLSMAHLMHGHLLAFHEAAHGSLCPNHRLNDALGVFIGIPIWAPNGTKSYGPSLRPISRAGFGSWRRCRSCSWAWSIRRCYFFGP